MKKFLFSLVVMMFSLSAMAVSIEDIPKPTKMGEVTDVTTIKSTAFLDDGTVPAIMGYVVGLETPPMGDYKVRIKNCKQFKPERFTLMTCTLSGYLEEVYDDAPDMGVVSSAFNIGGNVYNSLGFYDCPSKLPSDGYQVVIKNGKDNTLWNAMDCRIK